MPAKKAARKSSSSDMNAVWMWVYAIGTVVAAFLGGFAFQNDIVTLVLIIVAVLLGLFYFDPEDFTHFGIRVVALFVAKEGLSLIPMMAPLGSFFSGFFNGWLGFLYPIVLAQAVRFFWERRIAPLF
jgi:hypothetical protein